MSLALLNALRDWRAELFPAVVFFHVLERERRLTRPVDKPWSQLSVKTDPAEGRAGVGYVLTEKLNVQSLVDATQADIYDTINQLEREMGGRCDYIHGASIWSHQFHPELLAVGGASGMEATLTWTGRASWLSPAPNASLWTVSGSQFSGPPADSWAWDFGDGHTDTVRNPVHVLAVPSTVTLVVRNRAGRSTFARMVTP